MSPTSLAKWPLWGRALVFKAGWLGLVLTQTMAVVPVLLLWLVIASSFSRVERISLLLLMLVGVVLDALAVWAGVLQFSSGQSWLGLPLYYVMLWGWFAACWLWCFRHWFGRGLWTVGFAASIPLAYVGGSQLGQDLRINSWLIVWWVPAWWLMFWWSCRQLRAAPVAPQGVA